MSLLSWNYRGLGNPQTVNALKKVIRIEDSIIVFLMETKSNEDQMKMVRDQCGFKQSFAVPSIGLSGRLALFWKDEIKMEINKSALSHIDAIVKGEGKFGQQHLTGFYGNPDIAQRAESWELLQGLSGLNSLPQLIIGDFNEIVCASERKGVL